MNALWSELSKSRSENPEMGTMELAKILKIPASIVLYNIRKQEERN